MAFAPALLLTRFGGEPTPQTGAYNPVKGRQGVGTCIYRGPGLTFLAHLLLAHTAACEQKKAALLRSNQVHCLPENRCHPNCKPAVAEGEGTPE